MPLKAEDAPSNPSPVSVNANLSADEAEEKMDKALKAEVTTPDGQKGRPIPGELGYRAEFWEQSK